MQGRPSTHSQRNLYKLVLDAPEERQTPPCPVRTKQTHTQLLREIKQSISASSRRLLFPRWRRFIHGCDHAQPQLYDSTHLLTPRLYVYTASAAHAQKRTLPSTHSGAALPWTLCQWSTSCTLGERQTARQSHARPQRQKRTLCNQLASLPNRKQSPKCHLLFQQQTNCWHTN